MDAFSIIIPLLLSSLLGLTGYLKDMREENIGGRKNAMIGGARTLFLLSLLGLISGAVFKDGNVIVSLLISVASVSFVIVFYAITASKDQNSSFSDELSAIMAHILSLLWVLGTLPHAVLLAAFVATIFILEQRDALVSLGKKVSSREASEIIAYMATALIILPFLPQITYSLSDLGVHPEMFGVTNGKIHELVTVGLFNPYKIWFIVVFVSGIDIVGFFLRKIFSGDDDTSDVLPAFIGGFVSSTSTTIALAARSKKERKSYSLAAAAVLANISSFFQLFVLIAPISLVMFQQTLPFLVGMSLGGGVYAYLLLRHKKIRVKKKKNVPEIQEMQSDKGNIFNLAPALKFAVLLTSVKVLANISLVLVGSTGFIITALIASLTGVDAITITLADLVNGGAIASTLAISVFVLINAVNLVSKVVYTKVSGSHKFFTKFTWGVVIMLLTGIFAQLLSSFI